MKRIAIFAVFGLGFGVSIAQHQQQYPLFIYSFTRYVQWPEDYNKDDFEILVLGETPQNELLDNLAKAKKAGNRTIKVTKIDKLSEIRKCNILFVPKGNAAKFDEILAKISGMSILIITEEDGMGLKGSCVNFIDKDGKLAFEMNQSALNKYNLKASNELIRLAIMI